MLASLLLALGAGAVSACGSSSPANGGPTIALLLPESKATRYEAQDRPHFVREVRDICPRCNTFYANANQDAARQQQQADAALTRGVQALVLDPVDAASAGAIVAKAKQQNVPVISYDRLVTNAPVAYYISFDNRRVGELQAQSLVAKLTADGKGNGTIPMINGSPTDTNAQLFKAGATSVFRKSRLKIAKVYDTPDWSPDKAETEMQQAITALGKSGFAGVYAANDGTAGGAIAAMRGAGIDPHSRPTTGQDAELAAIQRIVAGEQYMTVYKAVKPEAEAAARIAVALARGERVPGRLVNAQTDDGAGKVPSLILTPIAVTKADIASTVVKDRFWTTAQICTGRFAVACRSAHLR